MRHSWKWGVLKYLDELCICTSGRLNLCSSFQHSSLRGVMNDLLREHSLHLNFNQTDFQWAKFLTFEPLNLELQTCGPKIIFSSQSTQSQKVSRHIIIWRIGTLIFQSPYLRVHSSKLPWKMFLVRGVQPFSQKPSLGGKFSPLPKKALHPQRVLELSAKREIIQWNQHSWSWTIHHSNIKQKLKP